MSIFLCSLFLNSCATKSIDIIYDGHIYIKTYVNDVAIGNFMYDTGASNFCLDTTFVKNNNLQFKKVQNTKMGGVGSQTQIVNSISDIIHYKVDKKSNHSSKTYLIGLKEFMGEKIDGILGVTTFQDRPHKIDFINKKLTFTDGYKNYDSIKFIYDGERIYIPMEYTIDKKQYSGKFIVDLGSTVTVLNNTSGIDATFGSNLIAIGGIGGETSGKTLFVDNFKLGDQSISHYPIDISKDIKGALADTNFDGLLGTDLLDDFDVGIDLRKEILYLKTNKKNNKHNKLLYKSFSYIDNTNTDGSWIVSYIYLDTDAYRKGLRLYDKILEINGVKVTELNRVEFYKSLKLNQKLELLISRNEEEIKINLVLDKFLGGN